MAHRSPESGVSDASQDRYLRAILATEYWLVAKVNPLR